MPNIVARRLCGFALKAHDAGTVRHWSTTNCSQWRAIDEASGTYRRHVVSPRSPPSTEGDSSHERDFPTHPNGDAGTPSASQRYYSVRVSAIAPDGPLHPYSLQLHAPREPRVSGGGIKVRTAREWLPVPGRWLRDMCSCPECRNQETGQKQINVMKMDPLDFVVTKAETPEHATNTIQVEFGDGHRSTFSYATLTNRVAYSTQKQRHGLIPLKTWSADVSDLPPSVSYADVQAGPGMATLLHKIREFGFAFVDDMPATPEATQALLESIGPIRNTHYGGFYDFTSDLSSKDTAYTSEALEPHTDNTYFTDPAGLQALHLLSHTDGSGGESSLVDGFGAADQLYREDRSAYIRLANTGVYAHASGNDGISIQPAQPFPTFSHHPRMAHLMQVRWNNADRVGLAANMQTVERWYEAAAKFDAIISEPKNQYRFQLKPGKMLIFDNWRVLHGRSAFTGKRRMCGGYINRDDFISKYRMTNLSEDEIEASTIVG